MSLQEILQLPPEERLQLVEQIWESLDPNDIKVTTAQKNELDDRIAADKAGKMKWLSLDEVKDNLDRKR